MATTLSSDKSETKVGTSGTKIYTSTRTTYSIDSNGKIDPKSVKHELIYYDAPLSPGVVAATSTGTSNNWTFANKPISNTPYLGADAQKSLKEGALKNTTQQQIQTAATKAKVTAEQQKALSTKQLNTAPATSSDGTQPITLNVQGSGQQRDKENSFGVHVYPLTLRQSHQDTIKFTMLKYEPRQIGTGAQYQSGNLAGVGDRSKKRISLGTVVLPVPAGISEINGVQWGQDTMDPGQLLLANIALAGIQKGLSGASDVVGGAAAGAAGQGNQDVKNAVATSFAEAASGVGGLLSRTQGAIINPNMELLFQGPTLRPFNFSFKMSARNSAEAKAIIQIIRFFKQGMSPQKSQSNLFLKTPHTFKIQYMYGSKEHPYIGQIKECGLQNFTVNYTPEAQYATFHDGPMVSYEIQMTFQELEPVFNEDYGNQGSDMPSDLLFRPSTPSSKP
jgi:hypothetical protein